MFISWFAKSKTKDFEVMTITPSMLKFLKNQ